MALEGNNPGWSLRKCSPLLKIQKNKLCFVFLLSSFESLSSAETSGQNLALPSDQKVVGVPTSTTDKFRLFRQNNAKITNVRKII